MNILPTFAATADLSICAPLSGIVSSGFVLGTITLFMSIICFCTHCLNFKNPIVCCSALTFVTLAFFPTLIANTVFVAQNINDPDPTKACRASDSEVALAALSLSWILLPMFGLLCLWSNYNYFRKHQT